MIRRGAVLFELLVSIAIFLTASAFTLGAVRSVVGTLDRSRREAIAVDIACSKMAELEAGLITLSDLRLSEGRVVSVGSFEALAEDDMHDLNPFAREWEITAESSPTEFEGLTLIELTVAEVVDAYADDDDPAVSFTLRQLVALIEEEAEAFEEDEIMRGLPEGDTEGGAR
jgi:hypothetical protein